MATNSENRVEDITRKKIYGSKYWKEHCFGLNAETLVDRAVEISYIGGTYGGNRKPTPFMCLILKMLQIRPDRDIILEFIRNTQYKYVRILGAFYLRLTGHDVDIYTYLELLYSDYRKLRLMKNDGSFALIHVDEVVDDLLTKNFYFDIVLPAIQKRCILMRKGLLDARKSILEDDFDEDDELEDEDEKVNNEQICEKNQKKSMADDDYYREYPKEYYDYYHERRGRGRDRNLKKRSYSRSPTSDGYCGRRRSWKCERRKKTEKKNNMNIDDGMGWNSTEHPKTEIAEANRLRASLGLKPLKI